MRGPTPDPIALNDLEEGDHFLTRGVRLEFLVGADAWLELLFKRISVVSNRVASVGRSSFTRETLLVGGGNGVGAGEAQPPVRNSLLCSSQIFLRQPMI